MDYTQRVDAFSQLGDRLMAVSADYPVLQQAYLNNPWFTIDMQLKSLQQWGKSLNRENLEKWLGNYDFSRQQPKRTVALILAGNIPLVGFHDILCVLLAGHKALIKTSSDDDKLIHCILERLIEIEPKFGSQIQFAGDRKLEGFDAVIATGSNNTNRYFEYYFNKYPSILRRNRTSIAVLQGNESESDFLGLSEDVFQYFGLGCRNVSKVMVPKGFRFDPMFLAFERYKEIIHHNKYANNYTYHKALFLMNQDPHLDNGFLILKEDDGLHSPLGTLFFQFYDSQEELESYLNSHSGEIQCIVGNSPGMTPFGQSQNPALWDYADGINTLKFLLELK